MRLHDGVFCAHMFGQINGHRRWCLTGLSAPFERDAHGIGMRRSVRECVLDRGLQFAWTEAIEQPQQFQGEEPRLLPRAAALTNSSLLAGTALVRRLAPRWSRA